MSGKLFSSSFAVSAANTDEIFDLLAFSIFYLLEDVLVHLRKFPLLICKNKKSLIAMILLSLFFCQCNISELPTSIDVTVRYFRFMIYIWVWEIFLMLVHEYTLNITIREFSQLSKKMQFYQLLSQGKFWRVDFT